MFASNPRQRLPSRVGPEALTRLAERARPVSASRTQLLPVIPPLADLLPERALRRGSTVLIAADEAGGATTLALALVSAASTAGSWCVAVGLPDIGALAASELSLDLAKLAFVPWPGSRLADAAATLIEGVDLVVLRPPPHMRAVLSRRLVARSRDRRAVLIVVDPASSWPERADVELRVQNARWMTMEPGGQCLRQRLVSVTATGRGSADQHKRRELWLPAESRLIET